MEESAVEADVKRRGRDAILAVRFAKPIDHRLNEAAREWRRDVPLLTCIGVDPPDGDGRIAPQIDRDPKTGQYARSQKVRRRLLIDRSCITTTRKLATVQPGSRDRMGEVVTLMGERADKHRSGFVRRHLVITGS